MIKQKGIAQPIVAISVVIIVLFFLSPYILNIVEKYKTKEILNTKVDEIIEKNEEKPETSNFAIPKPDYKPSRVLFADSIEIFEYDENTKKVILLKENVNTDNFGYDQEKNILYYLKNGEIWKFERDTNKDSQISNTKGNIQEMWLSPSKDKFAVHYVVGHTKATPANLDYPVTAPFIYDINSKKLIDIKYSDAIKNITEHTYDEAIVERWAPDGSYLIIRGHGFLDTTNNFWEVNPLSGSVKKFTRFGDFPIHKMPDIAYINNTNELAWENEDVIYRTRDSEVENIIKLDKNTYTDFIWSKDEKKVAISTNKIVSIFDLNSKELQKILDYTGSNNMASIKGWTGDNRFIVIKKSNNYNYKERNEYDEIIIYDTVTDSKYNLSAEKFKYGMDKIDITIFYVASNGKIYYKVEPTSGNSMLFNAQLRIFDISTQEDELITETDIRGQILESY